MKAKFTLDEYEILSQIGITKEKADDSKSFHPKPSLAALNTLLKLKKLADQLEESQINSEKGRALQEWVVDITQTLCSNWPPDLASFLFLLRQKSYLRNKTAVPISYYTPDADLEIHENIILEIKNLWSNLLSEIKADPSLAQAVSAFLVDQERVSSSVKSEKKAKKLADMIIVDRFFLDIYDSKVQYSLSLCAEVLQKLKISAPINVQFTVPSQLWFYAGQGMKKAISYLLTSIPKIELYHFINITETVAFTNIGLFILGLLHPDSNAHRESYFRTVYILITQLNIDLTRPILKWKNKELTSDEFLNIFSDSKSYHIARTKNFLSEISALLKSDVSFELPLDPSKPTATALDHHFVLGTDAKENKKLSKDFPKKYLDSWSHKIAFEFSFLKDFEIFRVESNDTCIYLNISLINYTWYLSGYGNPYAITAADMLKKHKKQVTYTRDTKESTSFSEKTVSLYRIGFLLLGLCHESPWNPQNLRQLAALLIETGVSLEEPALEIDQKTFFVLDMLRDLENTGSLKYTRNWLLACGAMPDQRVCEELQKLTTLPAEVVPPLTTDYSLAELKDAYAALKSPQAFCWKKRLYIYQLPEPAATMLCNLIAIGSFGDVFPPTVGQIVIKYYLENHLHMQASLKYLLGIKEELPFENSWSTLFPRQTTSSGSSPVSVSGSGCILS